MSVVATHGGLKVHQLRAFRDNYLYMIVDDRDRGAWVVDPGDDVPLNRWRRDEDSQVRWLGALITHHHSDHIGGLGGLLQSDPEMIVIASREDQRRVPGVRKVVRDQDRFEFLSTTVTALHLPAHTKGLTAYWFEAERWIFVGDALFAMGCGRLFEGGYDELYECMMRLRQLPYDTLVFAAHEYTLMNAQFALSIEPGNLKLQERLLRVRSMRDNGLATVPFTIADEIETNPFFRPESPEIRMRLGLEGASNYDVLRRLRELRDEF